jgi:hypothetical protein
LFIADEEHARQRLIEAEVAVTQGQLVIIAVGRNQWSFTAMKRP